MPRTVTAGPKRKSRKHELKQKRRKLDRAYDVLAKELSTLKRRWKRAAARGGDRAVRECVRLDMTLAKKSEQQMQLAPTIVNLHAQITDERKRLEDEKLTV